MKNSEMKNRAARPLMVLIALVVMLATSSFATYAELAQLDLQEEVTQEGQSVDFLSAENVTIIKLQHEAKAPSVDEAEESLVSVVESEKTEPTATQVIAQPYNTDDTITVYMHKTGESVTVDLEEYLVGVLACEVPYSFDEEALKAQAVAARSYIIYRKENNNANMHPNGEDICTNPAHCLAYTAPNEFNAKFGQYSEAALSAYQAAVSDTYGEILTYESEVALAVFHAMSGGATETAETVWGYDYPYLQSAQSAGEESFVNYSTQVKFTRAEFEGIARALGASDGDIATKTPIEVISFSEGGGADSVLIYGVEISGTKARSEFGLRTSLFDVAIEEDEIVFTVLGWGHRVGLSQYGAQAMALEGSGYLEILGNYYLGCEVQRIG